MGCSNSNTNDESNNKNNNNSTKSNNNKQAVSEKIQIIYYSLENVNESKLEFKEKNKYLYKKEVSKSKVTDYLRSSDDKFFKEMSDDVEQLENIIFYFKYNTGKSDGFNLSDAEQINILESETKSNKIWLININNIELDIEEIFNEIKDKSDLNNLILEMEIDKLSDNEPDLEDNGEVEEFEDPEEAIKLEFIREIEEENTDIALQSLDEDIIVSLSIRKNFFKNFSQFERLVYKVIEKQDELETKPDSNAKFLNYLMFSENFNATGFDQGWILLFELISKIKNLNHLHLGMSFLYDKYLTKLINAIKKKKLLSLDLSSNFLTHIGAEVIGHFLKGNRTLQVLNIQQNTMNEFKKEGFDLIVNPLIEFSHPQLMQLDVSHMVLTGFSDKLVELLRSKVPLKILRIKNVRMNYDDFKTLIPEFGKSEKLEELNISENDPMIDESIDYIGNMIKKNKKIEILYMDKIGINSGNVRALFNGIKENTTLNTLSINEHPDLEVKSIVKFFKENTSITSLNCSCRKYKKSKNELKLITELEEARPDLKLKI